MRSAVRILAPNYQVDGKMLSVGSGTQYPKKKAKTIWARKLQRSGPCCWSFLPPMRNIHRYREPKTPTAGSIGRAKIKLQSWRFFRVTNIQSRENIIYNFKLQYWCNESGNPGFSSISCLRNSKAHQWPKFVARSTLSCEDSVTPDSSPNAPFDAHISPRPFLPKASPKLPCMSHIPCVK
jgi:hypothetical protein